MADENASAGRGPGPLRDRYEQLRERVLAGRPDGWRLGHAMLARRGMAAWIAAQAALGSPPAGAPAVPTAAAAPGPAGDCGQIVAVLAQMALAHAA